MNDLGYSADRIMVFIGEQVRLHGFPPTVREICDGVGLRSTSTVHGHLHRLEELGLIRRVPGSARAIELIG